MEGTPGSICDTSSRLFSCAAAAKTLMVLCEYGRGSVVVTADADCQHHPEDVVAVGRFGEAHAEALFWESDCPQATFLSGAGSEMPSREVFCERS